MPIGRYLRQIFYTLLAVYNRSSAVNVIGLSIKCEKKIDVTKVDHWALSRFTCGLLLIRGIIITLLLPIILVMERHCFMMKARRHQTIF